MPSYPYYQPSARKTTRSPSQGTAKGMSAPNRPGAVAPPKASAVGEPAGALAQPISQSPIYDGEIGGEEIQLRFDREDLLKGMIYSEVLSPPKSKRTGR